VSLWVDESVGWWVSGLVSRWVDESVGWWVGGLVSWWVGQLVGWWVGGLVSRWVDESVGWSVGGSVGCSVGGLVSWWVAQLVGQWVYICWAVSLTHFVLAPFPQITLFNLACLYFRLSSCGDLLIELFLHSNNILFKITTSFLFQTLFPECRDVFSQSQDDILTAILSTITSMPRVKYVLT
jgi:hypothetical protein